VVRDGRDVCVSRYHHRRSFKGYTGSFDEHFQNFLFGTEYNWFNHVAGWLAIEQVESIPRSAGGKFEEFVSEVVPGAVTR